MNELVIFCEKNNIPCLANDSEVVISVGKFQIKVVSGKGYSVYINGKMVLNGVSRQMAEAWVRLLLDILGYWDRRRFKSINIRISRDTYKLLEEASALEYGQKVNFLVKLLLLNTLVNGLAVGADSFNNGARQFKNSNEDFWEIPDDSPLKSDSGFAEYVRVYNKLVARARQVLGRGLTEGERAYLALLALSVCEGKSGVNTLFLSGKDSLIMEVKKK